MHHWWAVADWWDAGVVMCLGQGADFHMAHLMPLPLTTLAPLNPDWFYLPGWLTVLSVAPLAHCVICLSSVTFCIVAKRYVLAGKCPKERIGNQDHFDFGVAAIFLLPVLPLRPPRWPFLPYFCLYSPAIGTRWYKWTFQQQTMCVLSDCVVRIETGSSFSLDYWPRKV